MCAHVLRSFGGTATGHGCFNYTAGKSRYYFNMKHIHWLPISTTKYFLSRFFCEASRVAQARPRGMFAYSEKFPPGCYRAAISFPLLALCFSISLFLFSPLSFYLVRCEISPWRLFPRLSFRAKPRQRN